jgi:Fe-S cluster assembly ATP-binding protein
MGHPKYEITKGKILYNGEDITEMEPNERAKKGLFLSFQYPSEVSGVSVSNFLRTALNSKRESPINVIEFRKLLMEKLQLLKMDKSFMNRYLNEGFSGGEKKRAEILQLAVLEPKMAILDETDSGLDIDSLKTVANGINKIKTNDRSILIITHYQRILNYITPDKVYVLVNGKIVESGGKDLVNELEEHGYAKWGSEESTSEEVKA